MLDSTIISACPDGILTVDEKGRITGVNNAARDMFGWPGDALVGQHVNVLVRTEMRRKHETLVHNYASGGKGARLMRNWRCIEAQRRDGSRFPVNVWLAREMIGDTPHTVAFIRDMSETAELENALAQDEAELARRGEQNALLALVAEHATDSVIITDAEGLTLWVNPATEKLSGYTAEEFAGRAPGDLLQGPGTDPETVRQISEAIHEGRDIRCEILNYTKTGESYWIEMNITPIRDADGYGLTSSSP